MNGVQVLAAQVSVADVGWSAGDGLIGSATRWVQELPFLAQSSTTKPMIVATVNMMSLSAGEGGRHCSDAAKFEGRRRRVAPTWRAGGAWMWLSWGGINGRCGQERA
ncbi:MAG: hypothetical protein H6668_21985 [Ardenticatenaceae bacterium]|nr:hypothetical protein [Ardenticatenaceae bacterium]